MINQVVILSAGLGTRLRPLTDNIPKVMVPISGKPLLEHHILSFKKYGIKEFFVNLYYLPDVITNYFGDGAKWGVKITYFLEPEIRGTAGGVKSFENQLGENFFVIYGDMYSEVDYTMMAKAFAGKTGAIGMMAVGENDHPQDSDLVEVDDDMRFLKIYIKPHGYDALPENFKTMDAIYIFNRRVLSYIPANKYYEIDHKLLPDLIERGERFYGYECGNYLKDIGTLERYKQVKEYVERKVEEGI